MKKILFHLSGSIAAYKSLSVISELVQSGFEVQAVQTESSKKFIGAASLEGLTGQKVLSDFFEEGSMMAHIHQVDQNDLQVLCPATLNTLVKLSLGFCDDLVSCFFQARDPLKKFLIFPAMNHRMWNSEACVKAVQRLRKFKNVIVFEPESGHQACGHNGAGRLINPVSITDHIIGHILNDQAQKVLLVFGGTRENIDSVRSLGNMSTGQTGIELYKNLRLSFQVDLCFSEHLKKDIQLYKPINKFYFSDFKSLNLQIKTILEKQDYDSIIFMPAVSDYSIEAIEGLKGEKTEKISSEMSSLNIKLGSNFKILPQIKKWKPGVQLIGFKLTVNNKNPEEKISKVAQYSDFVVHNDLSKMTQDQHGYSVYDSQVKKISSGTTKQEMSQSIKELILGIKN